MDLNILSKLLRDLLLTHDRVSLPGMGSFISELAPSVFSDRAMVIHPPFKRVLFRTSETWNDELLENLLATELETDINSAKETIQSFVREFKNDLNEKRSIKIPDFGTMRATDQKDYFFVADKNLFIYPDAYGLEPLNVKVLTKPGRIEQLNYKESRKSYIAPQQKPEKPGKSEKAQKAQKVPKVPVIRKPLSKTAKRTIIFFFVLLAIVAVIALMVIFKDELKPFWEWILYSKDDRALLKQM